MSYDESQVTLVGDIIDLPVEASATIKQTEAIVYREDDGMVERASTKSAYRQFAGIANEAQDNSSGSDGDKEVELTIGKQIIGNVTIIGNGASGVLQETDKGKVVYAYGENSYSADPKKGGVPCGILTRVRTAGSSNDGTGDILLKGFGENLGYPTEDWFIHEDQFFYFADGTGWDITAPDSGTSSIVDEKNGVLELQPSDGTVGGDDEIYCASDGEVYSFVADKPGFWEWEVKVDEANTDEAGVFVGLTDTVTMLADTTLDVVASYVGAGFYKPHSDLFFHTSMNDGTEDDSQPSSQTAWTDGQWYTLGIEYIPGATEGTINFYIDKVLYDSKSFTISGASEMHAEMGIKNESTNNNTLSVRRYYGRQLK